jgi:flagellum-specific peptidoglycan hydrolase FlgJ
MLTPEQTAFLSMAAKSAVECERATGCPAELTVAQAILESSWGKNMPGMNALGIKATDTHETYQITREYLNGQWVTMQAAFEAYDSLADCFTAHARLIQGGPYLPAWRRYQTDHSLDGLIEGIAHIYASDPSYQAQIKVLAHGPHVAAAIVAARSVTAS